MKEVQSNDVADARCGRYVVILVCNEIDHFGHNGVFAEEIGLALIELGFRTKILDYRREIRSFREAVEDQNCAFFVCFNGFGSELALPNQTPGELLSAFGYYGKLIFDLMHDCPTHESMLHQMRVTDPSRHLLITDYGYVQEAQELGVRHINFVPSITFPETLSGVCRSSRDREIQILLPVQLPKSESVENRFAYAGGYRHRIFRELYEIVSQICEADLNADPRIETRRACREADITFDVQNPDHRFLLTGILDRTKFTRRHRLVDALRGLPVTLLTNAAVEDQLPAGFLTAPARSFKDLLVLMNDASCVICPLPHMTGFHERALGAFTAGAAVIAAPNAVLQTHFRHGQDMLTYNSAEELADLLSTLLIEPGKLLEIGESGRDSALNQFSPRRLAETLVSIWRLRQPSNSALA